MFRGFLTSIALVCSLLLAGCGDDDDKAPAYTPLTRQNFASTITAAMAGLSTYHMHMDEDGTVMDLDVQVRKGRLAGMAGTIDDEDGPAEMVLAKGQIYVKGPGEKKWVRFPPEVSTTLLATISEGNPRDVARDFRTGTRTFRHVGDEEIDGSTFHRYDISMKPAFVRKKLAAKAARAGQELPEGFKVPKFNYVILLDDANRFRRLSVTTAGTTVPIDFTEWGEPVTIKAPPAGQVEEMTTS